MSRKLLVVYNTCGLSGREKVGWYVDCINNILKQDFDDFRVVVSSCKNSISTIKHLVQTFGRNISYNFISDRLTVNQTFNHTVQKCVESLGEFEGYLYVDSGINFRNNTQILKESYDLFKSGPYGMVTVQASNDTGFKEWFGFDGHITGENFEIPIGRACNLHTQIFSNEIFKAYNKKIIPDIFVAYCTESIFSFVNAGVKQKWIILKDLVTEHLKSVDGATCGFSHIGDKGDSKNNLFGNLDIHDILSWKKEADQDKSEAWDCGCGYEEMQGVFFHDPEKYVDGFVKDPERLKEFIRTKIFLDKSVFDYDKVKHKFLK